MESASFTTQRGYIDYNLKYIEKSTKALRGRVHSAELEFAATVAPAGRGVGLMLTLFWEFAVDRSLGAVVNPRFVRKDNS